jgi:tetratricopeptide (TPR) repeat protein
LVEEAGVLAGDGAPDLLRARLLLGHGRTLTRAGRWAEACSALDEAARLAATLGGAGYETLIIALVLLEAILPELGRVADAERASAQAIALARERNDRLHLGAALNNRRNVLVARKDVQGAKEDQEAFMRIGRELGILVNEYYGEGNLCELLYQSGELEPAFEHAVRASEIERRHPEVVSRAPIALLYMARIEAYRGREPEARELLSTIAASLRRAKEEGRASAALNASQQVLFDMVDLATRDSTTEDWKELLVRSARDSVEQEAIEVADLYGTWALRRGRIEEARRAFEEAAARAARIPNIMDARVKRGLEATGVRTT